MINGISVIICCYNSEQRIKKVLEHLNKQEYKNISWEVILVDNASKDDTVGVAKREWKLKEVPLHIIYEPKPGLSFAREAGIKSSRYEIISFIDDDNWIASNYISTVHSLMINHSEIAILGANGEPVFETGKPEWFDDFQDAYAVGPQRPQSGFLTKPDVFLYGAGLSFRKSVLEMLLSNGFHFLLTGRISGKITSGDDSELCLAVALAGYELYYDSNLKFKHFITGNRLSLSYLKRLIKSFGQSAVIIDLYYSELNDAGKLYKFKYQNTLMSVIYYLYLFLKSIPGYLKSTLSGNKIDRRIFNFKYNFFALMQKIAMFHVFPKYVKEIKKAKWRKI